MEWILIPIIISFISIIYGYCELPNDFELIPYLFKTFGIQVLSWIIYLFWILG